MEERAGFTLLELLVSVAIGSLLIVIGAPAFTDLVKNQRRTTQVNALVRALHLAKGEAIMRARSVVLCKSRDGRQCGDARVSWGEGWIVFVDLDRDRQAGAGEPIRLTQAAYRHGSARGNRTMFIFGPALKRSTAGTVVFCDARGPPEARAVIVSYTGRPRIATRDARRRALLCPLTP